MKYLLFYIKICCFLFLFSCMENTINRGVIEVPDTVEVIFDKENKKKKDTEKEIKKIVKKEDKNIEKTNPPIKIEEPLKTAPQALVNKIDKKDINNKSEIQSDIDIKYQDFNGPIKIGLLVPLAGKNAFLGNAIYQSAEMSLFETKASNIELLPIDSGSTIESAVQAVKILEKKNVSIIIGPIFSSQAVAVRSVLKNNIPLLSFTNDESISGKGLWAFGFTPRQEIAAVFEEMVKYKIKTLSVIIPNSAYGSIALENIKNNSLFLNIELKDIYKYSTSTNSFSGLGLELKENENKEIDALLILAGGKKLREISSRAQYRGINPKKTKYFGISSWNSPQILGEPSLLKGVFIAPEQSSFESFVSRYYKIYGAIPPEIAGLSYDIVSLCNSALNKSKNIQGFLNFLTKPSGFNGVFGYFSISSNGNLKRKFASYQVMKRSFVKK